MFSTIVVGTDGSQDADRALRVGAELGGLAERASVHVVTGYRPLTPRDLEEIAQQLPDEYRMLLRADMGAEDTLASARQTLEAVGVTAEYHEIDGDPTEAILDTADRVGADLIVVGSRGEGMAKRALHGSVSTKIMHHAPCAVLVVKED